MKGVKILSGVIVVLMLLKYEINLRGVKIAKGVKLTKYELHELLSKTNKIELDVNADGVKEIVYGKVDNNLLINLIILDHNENRLLFYLSNEEGFQSFNGDDFEKYYNKYKGIVEKARKANKEAKKKEKNRKKVYMPEYEFRENIRKKETVKVIPLNVKSRKVKYIKEKMKRYIIYERKGCILGGISNDWKKNYYHFKVRVGITKKYGAKIYITLYTPEGKMCPIESEDYIWIPEEKRFIPFYIYMKKRGRLP